MSQLSDPCSVGVDYPTEVIPPRRDDDDGGGQQEHMDVESTMVVKLVQKPSN